MANDGWLAYSSRHELMVRGERRTVASYLRKNPGAYAISPKGSKYVYVPNQYSLQKVPKEGDTQ